MNLSIIVPVYNEEKRLENTLEKIIAFNHDYQLDAELIFVDDGSTDKTVEKLQSHSQSGIRIIRVWPNRGKGNAVKTGVLTASGDNILFMDADLATPLSEIPKILEFRDKADIIIGSRCHLNSNIKRDFVRNIAGHTFSYIKRLIVPISAKDSQCGFKLFRRSVAKDLFGRARIERWSFDAEILYLAEKSGYKIIEMPVCWEEKGGSKVKLIRDSYLMIKDLFRIRYFDFLGLYGASSLNLSEERLNEE